MPLLEKPFYRYDLRVDIGEAQIPALVRALEGEQLSLKTRFGWPSLKSQIEDERRIAVEILADDPWPDFENDLRTLSGHLPEPLVGREVFVSPAGEAPILEGWLIAASGGETARLPLALAWDEDQNMLVDQGVDYGALETPWDDVPAWVKAAIRKAPPSFREA